MPDEMQSVVRAVLKVGGGYVVARGFADQSAVEVAVAGVAALVGIIWGIYHRTK